MLGGGAARYLGLFRVALTQLLERRNIGQRMLGGVTKMMLEQFFTRMTEILAESA